MAAAESENFNRHDPGRAQMNLQRMREAAKAKVATTAKIGNMLDKNKELKLSNETLDMAIGQLGSDDWRSRKVAAYDVIDEVIVRTKKAREEGDTESMKYYFEKVEKHIIPLFCDANWWVRKAAIHGVVKLSKDDPSAIQVPQHIIMHGQMPVAPPQQFLCISLVQVGTLEVLWAQIRTFALVRSCMHDINLQMPI